MFSGDNINSEAFHPILFWGENKAVEYRKLDWKLPPHQTLARKGRLWVKATSLRICWHLTRCKMSAWKMACSTQIWTREDNVGMQLEFLPEKAFFLAAARELVFLFMRTLFTGEEHRELNGREGWPGGQEARLHCPKAWARPDPGSTRPTLRSLPYIIRDTGTWQYYFC